MEQLFKDDIYVIDLSYAKSASDIVFELSSIIDNDMAKNRKIALNLGDIDLNQSQLLSIRSLINSINSTVSFLETNSAQTELSANNLGIIISNVKSASEESVEEISLKPAEPGEQTYVASYEYIKLDDHLAEEESIAKESVQQEDEVLEENEETIISSEITSDFVINEEEAKEITETKAEDIQEALSDLYDTESKLEAILEDEQREERTEITMAEIRQAMAEDKNYTEEDFEIDNFPTMYVKQTLRSGQIINYEGNVIIIGDAHPGSEIVASGDITVWGILSGIAQAGSNGNSKAKIRALKMNAIQLRIAGCFARKPDGMNTIFPERTSTFTPEEARILNNEIVIFKLND